MVDYCDQSANNVSDIFPSTLEVEFVRSSTGSCEIRAIGSPYMISEFLEQIAWLVATLRLSALQGKLTVLLPRIVIFEQIPANSQNSQNSQNVMLIGRLDFEAEVIDQESLSTQGTCWTRLFTNPILVSGYPILRKSTPATGLETSLSIMASIVQAHQIVRIENRIVMKGFNSLVVASAVDGGSIRWHAFTSSKPKDRISYFDPQIEESVSNEEKTPLLRSLEGFRHIIGWCSEVTELCGKS